MTSSLGDLAMASARGSWVVTCSARFEVPWPDDTWRGWWGKNPPYHGPVFVLTHHARPSVEMEGGTVYHFVTKGIREAMESAVAAAEGKDVQISGGVATVRQYLEARLIDELHVAIAPRLLGSGEHLLYGLDLTALGYECTTHVPTAARNSCRADKTSVTRAVTDGERSCFRGTGRCLAWHLRSMNLLCALPRPGRAARQALRRSSPTSR